MNDRAPRGRLFRKYVLVLLVLVGGVLLVSSLVELYFSYQETTAALVRLEREKAGAAATRIEQFVKDIERQLRWTAHTAFDDPRAARDEREIDFLRLLRNVPAITELAYVDASGKEQLRVSRLALDEVGSGRDLSQEPKFKEPRSGNTYFGPVYFRNESEPYMTVAVPGGDYGAEVTTAEVNLKAIWDVISQIRVGRAGYAYAVDSLGQLIAHPDISLVLQKRDLSTLSQVNAARADRSAPAGGGAGIGVIASGLQGGRVLTAHAAIAPLGWWVFVEQPLGEAFAPLQSSIVRSAGLFVLGLVLSILASLALARKMVTPIRTLQAGAARIGAGELGHRIEVRTGDELEALADEFNRSTARLQESHEGLEQKVAERTGELARLVENLKALGEVSQALSSTLDVETVLNTIVSRASRLAGADGCSIYEYDEGAERFELRATHNLDAGFVEAIRAAPLRKGEGLMGRATEMREPVQIPDITQPGVYQSSVRDTLIRFGYRALLSVPLLREDHIIGSLSFTRKAPGAFPREVIDVVKNFATQSALAIQNARLFREIEDKGKQLEVASQHKSNFLASMSHELRTPLNAILGFNEMLLDQVYGEVPVDMLPPLAQIQTSGKHLLRLINNVLDLAKIEAGRMELSLMDYSVHDTVESVRSTLRPLAADKGLEFLASVPADLPLAYGDPGRITQCLMNLAGNSLKFTKSGTVQIQVEAIGDLLIYKVADTGIGIPPDKIDSLFTEFRQTDATIASEYGGTGLGLAISKKFVEMHGGRIWVESEVGKGSAFIFEIPLRVSEGVQA